MRNSTFVTVATIAVAVLGAAGALNSYLTSQANAQQYPDVYGGERAQTRFAPIPERVPGTGELGYLTDLDPSASAYAPAWLAAQYAVAPHLLVTINAQRRPEFAVGNFSRPADFAGIGEANGYQIVGSFNNGVILYHRL